MKKQKNFVGPLLAVVGAVMMIYGAQRGELSVLFSKAINVCLECIGIG